MISIYFEKLYAKDFLNEPCTISIPLPKGKLFSIDEVKFFQDCKELPLQKKITATWKDGSVKYLFCRFGADISANKKSTVFCALTSEDYPADAVFCKQPSTCLVTQAPQGFQVNTGVLSFAVTNKSQHLFSSLDVFSKHYCAEQFIGPLLKDSCDTSYAMEYDNWTIVEQGDVSVTLSCQGFLLSSLGDRLDCEMRITAYAQKTWIDLGVRLINTTQNDLCIQSYTFAVDAKSTNPSPRTCVASSNYKTDFVTSQAGETVSKEITPESLIKQSNEHFGEVFYGTFFADHTDSEIGVCGTIFQAFQNFPKAVTADTNGIVLSLVPDSSNPVTMHSGMAREQRFQLYFHDATESLLDINHRTTVYQMPNRPYLEPSVYEDASVFPDIFVKNKNYTAENALINGGDGHARCYGMMNWGDAPDPNYTAQGRGNGNLVWTNNEYDFPHACMLLYAKTGIRRFYDYCIVAGNHQIDVDICHYSNDPLLLGGQWEHTNGHNQNGVMVCSHEWVEGILDCYHLTGDERYLSSAIGIGENILRLLDTPMYQAEASFNARETGWALRTLTALYVETHDIKWNTKSVWIVQQFKDWSDHFGGWLAPYMDNVVIRVPFMISVAIGSLMRYYREFPSTELKAMMLHAVDDMVENCIMENGLFFYKELPSLNRIGTNPLVLEALAIAYELSGDAHYLKIGMPTFETVITRFGQGNGGGKKIIEDTVIVGSSGTKGFAQGMIPIATFYRALEKADLL